MTNPATPEELVEAYRLLKAGQRQQAGAILKPYLAAHQDDARAWWLMAHAVSNRDVARQCLEQVLKIDPTHERARARLAALAPAPAAQPTETPDDEPDDSFFVVPVVNTRLDSARQKQPATTLRRLDAPTPPPDESTVPTFEEFAAQTSPGIDPFTGEPVDNPFGRAWPRRHPAARHRPPAGLGAGPGFCGGGTTGTCRAHRQRGGETRSLADHGLRPGWICGVLAGDGAVDRGG